MTRRRVVGAVSNDAKSLGDFRFAACQGPTEVKHNAGTTRLAKFTWDALGRRNS
ncbi:MAG: hypothetical protein IPK83_19375 [Planctomycetes bacterium]|nr:hypothetical protein [Planctomycetota bacterium]